MSANSTNGAKRTKQYSKTWARVSITIFGVWKFIEADDCEAAFGGRGKDLLEPLGLHVDVLRVGRDVVRRDGEDFLAFGSAPDAGADLADVGVVRLADDDGVDAEALR